MKDSLMYHRGSAFLASLGGLIFKIFWHVAPNEGRASFVTNPQHPPSPLSVFKIPVSSPEYMSLLSANDTFNFNSHEAVSTFYEKWIHGE